MNLRKKKLRSKKYKKIINMLKTQAKINPDNFHYNQFQTPDGQSVLELKIIHRTVLMSDTSYSNFIQPSCRL